LGRNPSALQAQEVVGRSHRSILARLDVAERHFERAERLISARYDQEMAELEWKTKDRRRLRYKDRVAALARRRDKDIDRAGARIDSVMQDFLLGDRLISRVGDHHEGVTGGAVGDDC